MKARALLLAVALAAGGCAEPASEPLGDGELLRYGYQPGDYLVYEARHVMSMDVAADGDASVAGAFDTEMEMDLSSRVEYGFAEGPQPDTVAITVSTTFLNGSATMTQMGQTTSIPIDELTELGVIEATIVVDASGRPTQLTVGGQSVPLDLFGDLQGLGGLGGLATPQHMGPEFPDHPVTVGSSWETETVRELMGLELRQRGEHEIVAREIVAGRSVFKVESKVMTEAMEFDFADLSRLSMAAAGDLGPAEREQMEMAMEMLEAMGVEMRYGIDDTVVSMTSWFDAADGVVVQLDMSAPMAMTVEIRNMPDLPSGDMRMTADMNIRQSMRLTD
jgi:hypothetical protein